ncbi:hypothetical protein MBLNU230_g4429t1 [Neophaeotheca triangularis]
MSDAVCGPANPLQQFKQQTQLDRSLQQDRIASRQSPGQGFRSHDPRAGLLDPEFEAFQAGAAPLDLPQLQPALQGQGPYQQPGFAGPSQAPSWAADFQNLNISSAHPPQGFQQNNGGPSTAGWAQGFQQQVAQQAPRAYGSAASPQAFQQRARYGMSGFQSNFAQPAFAPSTRAESKAPVSEQFDDAAFERAFDQAREEMMPDAFETAQAPTFEGSQVPDLKEIAGMIQGAEVKGLRGGPHLPMLRMLLADSLRDGESLAAENLPIFQVLRLVATVNPAEISWMQRALTIPVLEHVLKRDLHWDTAHQAEGTLAALLGRYEALNATMTPEQQTRADDLSTKYAELFPKEFEVRPLPLAQNLPTSMQLDVAREGSVESQLFGGDNSLARLFESQRGIETLAGQDIFAFDLNLTANELQYEQGQAFEQGASVLDAQEARSQILASTLQAVRESPMYRGLPVHHTPGEPDLVDHEETLADTLSRSAEVLNEQQTRDTSQNQDDDALAETAGELLEKVKHNKSDKFQNSQFLGLMRRLRDRETKVEGDKMVETNGNTASAKNESLNASAGIDAPYFDNSEQLPAPLRPFSPMASLHTQRNPENVIPRHEQDHDAGRIDPRDGQDVVDLLNQPSDSEAGNDIGTSENAPREAVSHPRWWEPETTLPDMLYGPDGTLEGPRY